MCAGWRTAGCGAQGAVWSWQTVSEKWGVFVQVVVEKDGLNMREQIAKAIAR